MSTQIIHIGQTRIEVEATFGMFTLAVGEFGRPAQRVGTFDSGVAASRFVGVLTAALEGQEVDVKGGRSREAVKAEQRRELEALHLALRFPDPSRA